jgi:preprotein translocase subunit SecB
MKTAPIQLGQISFRRINVEVDVARLPEDGAPASDVAFDFEKVNIATHVRFSPMDETEAPGKSFFVVLQVVINNQASDKKDARYSPYFIDIEAGAVIRALPGSEALGDVKDLVIVNGASMLWSAIREQVCSLTARMPAGLVTLPTVNFHDLKQRQERMVPQPAPTASKRKPPSRAIAARKATSRQE